MSFCAHQLAVAHEMILRMSDRAMRYEHNRLGDQVEACRCANVVGRMVGAFQGGMQTLQKPRSGGDLTPEISTI